MFSSVFTSQLEYLTYLTVMSLLPWTLWRLETALEQKRLRPALEAGAIWGLTALSGYPAMFIIGEFYLGLWTLGRLLLSPLSLWERVRARANKVQDSPVPRRSLSPPSPPAPLPKGEGRLSRHAVKLKQIFLFARVLRC